MELEKQIIKSSQEKGRAFTQITLEDDYIVPDVRPDVLKVIHTQGMPEFEEPKIASQALWINGRLNFTVLYRSEDSARKLETVTGSIPFQEKLVIDGLEETDEVQIGGGLEDVSVSIINSRKLAVRAIVDIRVKAECEHWEEIAAGLPEETGCEVQIGECELLRLKSVQKDLLRIRKEVPLPQGKANIVEVIYHSIAIRRMETFAEERNIRAAGDADICILYQGQGEEEIQFYETTLPFEGQMENPGMEPEDMVWITMDPETMELELREDSDGELRILGVELAFTVHVKTWTEDRIPVLRDAYALNRKILLKREPAVCQRLLICNQTKVRVSEQIALEKNQEHILQICSAYGEVTIEHVTRREQGLFAEGMLKVHLLYFTNDEFLPVSYTEGFLPIEQLIEVPQVSEELHYEFQTNMEQFSVNLMDSISYEVKATVNLQALVFEESHFEKIVSLEEQPLDMETLQKQPGLIGRRVGAQEDLWSIAKEYHTTIAQLCKTNHLENENVHFGQKLVVVKEIMC